MGPDPNSRHLSPTSKPNSSITLRPACVLRNSLTPALTLFFDLKIIPAAFSAAAASFVPFRAALFANTASFSTSLGPLAAARHHADSPPANMNGSVITSPVKAVR